MRVVFYAVCATVVALFGWNVLAFGGALYLVFGPEQFPRLVFWLILAASVPLFFVIFLRYFDRHEPQ
jgi:hypothetical protein